MLYRVIISHNQTQNIRQFPGGCCTVFVLDAPTSEDIDECTAHGCSYVTMSASGNRGANRNAGVQKVLSTFKPSDDDYIEFFDGDRFPTRYNPEKVLSIMEMHNIQCMLYSCGTDARHEKIEVPEEGATLVDTGTLCNPFYSCGFVMRVSAILGIMKFNKGYLFEPRFTRWGSEDQYIGLICEHLKYRVAITRETILNGEVGGDCDAHQDYRESIQTYVDLIRENNLPFRNTCRKFEVLVSGEPVL